MKIESEVVCAVCGDLDGPHALRGERFLCEPCLADEQSDALEQAL